MPGLKFQIEGDDRKLRKTLKDLARDMDKDLTSAAGGLSVEIDKGSKATKRHTDLVHEQERAYKKRNTEAAKLPVQKRKVDMGNSAAEVAAYKTGQSGNIASGTVAGHHAALGAQANAATAASVAQAKLATETVKTTVANKAQEASIQSLQLKLQSYKNIANSATDPIRREQYNRKIQETTEQIARMENVGKKGFDGLGNAITKTQNPLQKAIAGIFRMAYLLPGIGVAGILAFAIDPIINWISGLSKAEKAQKVLNEAMQETLSLQAKASAETQIYISKLTNANIPLAKRQELLNEFILQNPTVLGALNLQNIATAEGKAILDEYTKSLRKKIQMQQNEKNFAESLQKEQDLASGKLSEETDLGGVKKFIFQAGEILTFGSKKAYEKRVKEMNDLRRAEAVKEQKVITKTWEDKINADIKGLDDYDKQMDSSLAALEKKLQTTSERLRTLQTGQDPTALKKEKKQLEMQVAARKKLLGLDEKPRSDAQIAQAAITAESRYQSMLEKRRAIIEDNQRTRAESTNFNISEDERELESIKLKYQAEREEIDKFNRDADRFNANPKNIRKIGKLDTKDIDIAETNEIEAAQDRQAQKEFEKNQALLLEFQSYIDKRLLIQKTGIETATKLRQLGDDAAAQEAITRAQEEITALDETNVQKLVSYKELFDNTEQLSRKATKTYLDELQKEIDARLAAGTITVEAYKKVQAQINKSKKSLKDDYVEGFYKAADALGNIASQMQGIDDAFSKTLSTVSNVVGGIGDLMKHREAFNKPGASGFDKALAGAGMVGAGIGIVKSIVGLFDKSEEKRQRAAEQQAYSQQLQLKAINAQTQALQRQLDLIKDIYGAERIQKFGESLQDMAAKQAELTKKLEGKYQLTGNKELDEVITKANKGRRLNTFQEILFEAYQKKGAIKSIDGLSMQQLLGLADEGKLDEQTAAIVANIQTLEKQIRDTQNELRAETTGTTFSSITDEIVQMFANGTTAAEDFGKNFEEIMKKSILNSFKRNALEKELQVFYEEFAKNAEDGLDSSEIGSLRQMYDAIITGSQKQFEDLQKATGVTIGGQTGPTSANGLQGAIRREMTESTASELTGLFRGQYDVTKRLLTATSDGFAKSHDIAMGGIRHLQAIEAHTFRTANNTDLLNSKLDMVIANTKQVVTGKGLGLP